MGKPAAFIGSTNSGIKPYDTEDNIASKYPLTLTPIFVFRFQISYSKKIPVAKEKPANIPLLLQVLKFSYFSETPEN
ncbi:hypothetical protein HHL16_15950 [Pseudoflavitalea sp. G-6-1-2]|uniref:hypothetical protein n=1 Tax=Pseudoflavitalea sp. G-6-1-2 TaxID=2728841 RepID=UPI00146CCE80|nr:hypothetical protein [Pseudoflavitalea sp. G-6-1-2]NML22377.1 hypothetical protein [Pseudoflavitalea sp. G-6-1-2]